MPGLQRVKVPHGLGLPCPDCLLFLLRPAAAGAAGECCGCSRSGNGFSAAADGATGGGGGGAGTASLAVATTTNCCCSC